MKKIIVLIGLSSDLMITEEIIKKIPKLTEAVTLLSENRIVGIISSEQNEAKVFSSMLREKMTTFKDVGYKKTFEYQGDSTLILDYEEWKEFIVREFQYYEILIVVCTDNKKYSPNPIKVRYSYFQFAEAVDFKQLFFN